MSEPVEIRVKLRSRSSPSGRACVVILTKGKDFPYEPFLTEMFSSGVLRRTDFPLEAECDGIKYWASIEREDLFSGSVESVVFEERK